jgi:hypothetical protein
MESGFSESVFCGNICSGFDEKRNDVERTAESGLVKRRAAVRGACIHNLGIRSYKEERERERDYIH